MDNVLNSSIRYLKGVGEAREKLFHKLGIFTLHDLILFFPRAYEDRTVFKKISELVPGESVCVIAMVAAPPTLSHIRKGLDLVKLQAVDESGSLEITYFNAPFVKNALKQGESYVFYGKNSGNLIKPEMINPVFERAGSTAGSATGCIIPVYPLTAKLTQKAVSMAVRHALDKCADILPDVLPYELAERFELCKARYAYYNIHFPETFDTLETARRRLIFEELFVLAAAMRFLRNGRGKQYGRCLQSPDFSEFYSAFSFEPTNAQKRAVDEAMRDMSSGNLMNRLIQGDVGSGKTLVAAACAWATWKNRAQSAFMAPTEVLANQHFRLLSDMLEKQGMHVGLLTGSMTAKRKREVHEQLRYGELDLVIGTHALLSEGVEFRNLALVITDEQHRFGVSQRSMLTEKGDSPHILVMSATPIPRTLALIIYGDLDVSIIDEMPPGRREIETHVVGERYRKRIYDFIRKLVGEGRQVYIICPMIEDMDAPQEPLSTLFDESAGSLAASQSQPQSAGTGSLWQNLVNPVKSVKEYHEALSNTVFPDLNIALLHGKMSTKAKAAAMDEFSRGVADILVATTVIEVGVDVPNAALIVVENADRFGLSQLHQLRGRVGRGEHKSYCVLFQTDKAHGGLESERLHVMKSTNDGFKIAEEDLKLRGPGDFFGSRQHGLPDLKVANLMSDMLVLNQAQNAAHELLRKDEDLSLPEHRVLAEHVKQLLAKHADSLN